MKNTIRTTAVLTLLALCSVPALAQTADEIIETHIAAAGGRAALAKLTSRSASGRITLTTPVGELGGTIDVFVKAPNKSRTLVKIDLSALGGGEVISDQRFDGATGYVIDTFNGNREITGTQLEALRNGAFPSPLLNYRDRGSTATLAGNEKVGEKDTFVIQLSPKTGPPLRMFIESDSFMLVKTATTINVPQLGGDVEQVQEFSDFREVDGIKLPYSVRSSTSVQVVTATLSDVKHNVEIDDSSFVRPAGQ
jgi:outer membrane lipoprotein-sorting protein